MELFLPQVWTVRDGKVIRVQTFDTREDADRAASARAATGER
jgi:hypothetical protein